MVSVSMFLVLIIVRLLLLRARAMDRLFFTVQNLQSLGCSVWVEARSVDQRTIRITLHYQTGESVKGLCGEDNVRVFTSPRSACNHLLSVFSSILGIEEVRHAQD